MVQLGVQLYTLREECSQDFLGTLEKVAALGYQGVEFAGFFDVPAEQLKGHLDQLGLDVVGSHTSLEMLQYHLDEVIEYNTKLGNRYIICPWATVSTAYEVDQLAQELGRISDALRKHDMILGYHNHDHEFKVIEGTYALTRLFSQLRGKVVSELDTFWVHRAGVDPVDYMKQIGHQLALVHLKDGTKDSLKALGEGEVNLRAIIEQSEKIGVKWLVVENDEPSPNGLDDVTRSINHLKTIRG